MGHPIIRAGNLTDPRVLALVQLHTTAARAANSNDFFGHALDVGGLQAPDVTFWTMWDEDRLAAFGALREIDEALGEVKSMHTAEALRGRGFGGAMLSHILDEARRRGYRRVSLETGTAPYFLPAQTLYRRHGFVECGPFGGYPKDPNSLFMTLSLD